MVRPAFENGGRKIIGPSLCRTSPEPHAGPNPTGYGHFPLKPTNGERGEQGLARSLAYLRCTGKNKQATTGLAVIV